MQPPTSVFIKLCSESFLLSVVSLCLPLQCVAFSCSEQSGALWGRAHHSTVDQRLQKRIQRKVNIAEAT